MLDIAPAPSPLPKDRPLTQEAKRNSLISFPIWRRNGYWCVCRHDLWNVRMTEPATILLSRVNGHGSSPSGQNSCLDLTDSNGRRFILHIPHLLEGDFLSRFEAAAMHAAEMRGSPSNADVISAVLAEQTSFVMADDGTLILRTKTRSGVEIDINFDEGTVAGLRAMLGAGSTAR